MKDFPQVSIIMEKNGKMQPKISLQEVPMPQLRQDPTRKEWVIIVSERSKRPHDFIRTRTLIDKPPDKEVCPFCRGNEDLMLHESLAYLSGGPAEGKG